MSHFMLHIGMSHNRSAGPAAARPRVTRGTTLAASLLLSASGVFAPQAHALLEMSKDTALLVQGQVYVEQDSNIYANANEVDDTVFVAAPSVVVESQAQLNYRVQAGVEVGAFADQSDENYEDFFANGSMAHDSGKSSWQARASARELSTANEAIGGRTESTNYNTSASLESLIFGKSGIRVAPSALWVRYDTANTYDYSIIGSEFGYIYEYSPKTTLGLQYRYRTISSDAPTGFEGDDHSVFVSARGDLLAKVKGELALGAQFREPDRATYDNDTLFYAKGLVTWQPGPKTAWVVTLQSDSASSAVGHDAEIRFIELRLRQRLTEQFSVQAGVRYTDSTYIIGQTERDDDSILLLASATYELTQYGSLFAEVRYQDQDSTNDFLVFQRSRFKAGVSFRF